MFSGLSNHHGCPFNKNPEKFLRVFIFYFQKKKLNCLVKCYILQDALNMKSHSYYYGIKCLFITLLAATFISCGDDDDDPNTNSATDGCSLPNGHLKWTMQGAQYCSNATLFADQAILMTINGITQSGITMTLELDSIEPGSYQMNDNTNHLLLTDQFAFDWQSTNDLPGTLIITKNDKANNWIEGTFTVNAKNSLTGTTKQISNGNFRVKYTE